MASMYEIEKNLAEVMEQVNKICLMLGIDTAPEPTAIEERVIERAIPVEHLENPPKFAEIFEQQLQNLSKTMQENTDPDA